MLRTYWNRLFPRTSTPVRRKSKSVQPRLQRLEDRTCPTTWVAPSYHATWMNQQSEMLADGLPDGVTYANQWVVIQGNNTNAGDLAAAAGVQSDEATPLIDRAHIWTFGSTTSPAAIATFLAQSNANGLVDYYYPLLKYQAVAQFVPNDTLYTDQWHLRNTGQGGGTAGIDANLEPAWDLAPNRGASQAIAILDTGTQYDHPDLAANRDAAHPGRDINDGDNDASPPAGSAEDHGTAVAGIAAAVGNNSLGVAGAGFNAKIVPVRMLGGGLTDADGAAALSWDTAQFVTVSNNSWKYPTQFYQAGPLHMAALKNASENGGGGNGVVFVFAAGNDQQSEVDANSASLNNSRFAITVAAITNDGKQSDYSERGANVFISAPSGGGTLGMTTTDRTGSDGYDSTDYTAGFSGTSAATPLVSGVVALVRDANPSLTYRDVRYILANTAKQVDPTDSDWFTNAAGMHVNHKFGFGLIDAGAAVSAATTWVNVGAEQSATGSATIGAAIPDNNPAGISSLIHLDQSFPVETVEVHVRLTHPNRGQLTIVLTSPSGTQSLLQQTHAGDDNANLDWVFTTIRNWGESSTGDWKLTISDGVSGDSGTWDAWDITVYGTTPLPPPPGPGGSTPGFPTLYYAPDPVKQGSQSTLVGAFQDPGLGQFSSHTVQIVWGDGSPDTTLNLSPGIQSFNARHTFQDVATFNTSVTVTGGSGTLSSSADEKVINVAPTVAINTIAEPADEGKAISASATVTDPGVNDTFKYSWAATKDNIVVATGTSQTFTFTPDDNADYAVYLTVIDSNKGVGSAFPQVFATRNVAPTASLTNNGPRPSGSPVTVIFVNPADAAADVNAGFKYSFDWNNDGDFIDAGEISDGALTSAIHTYPDGRHTVHGGIKDKDGGFTNVETIVSVGIGGNAGNVTTHYFAVGAGEGGGPHVRVNKTDGTIQTQFMAYAENFLGGVRVATGDVDGDHVEDFIVAPGPGGGPHVKVFSGTTNAVIRSFMAGAVSFSGGLQVASGDVNNDGFADIIVGFGPGGGSHVKVFSGQTSALLQDFIAYPGFLGAVNVAAADVNGDFRSDIITGPGAGGGPHVKIVDGTKINQVDGGGNILNSALISQFMAFGPTFAGGTYVSSGDVDGDGLSDILVSMGAQADTDSRVKVFNGADMSVLRDFVAFTGFRGGVRVGAEDLDNDGKADLILTQGPSKPSNVLALKGTNLAQLQAFAPYDPSFLGGVYVG